MTSLRKTLAIFSLAAFLSALTYSYYAAGVDSLYRANDERKTASYNPNEMQTYQIWLAEKLRIARELDHALPVLCLSFPLAMSFALVIATTNGWLPRFPFPRLIAGLLPIYLAPPLVVFVSGISRGLLLIPGLALAACLLKLSVAILTSRPPKRFILMLVLSNVICSLLYVVLAGSIGSRSAEPFAQGLFLVATYVFAAVLYAKALTPPATLVPHPATVSSGG